MLEKKAVDSSKENTSAKNSLPDEKLVLYSKAIEEAADGIQIVDLNGRVMYSNKAVTRIYGFSAEELIGIHVNDMNADPGFAERVIIPSIMETGGWEGELLVKHKDGYEFPVWINTSLVMGGDGVPIAMIGTIKDVTELKQAQMEIREQQERLKEQLRYESALNDLAETILANDDTMVIFETVVRIIGEVLGLDRTLLYEADFGRNTAFCLCEWDNPETPGLFPTKRTWPLDLFRNSIKYILENKTWLESHVDDINRQMAEDGIGDLIHQQMGVKSLIYYPFSVSASGFFLLIFHQTCRRRNWSREVMEFINAVAKQVEIGIQKIKLLEQQRWAEWVIWEEKERAQVTLESIGDAVITTSSDGMVEYLNPVAQDLTGWTNEEAKGRPLNEVFNIVNEETGEAVDNPVTRCIQEGRIVGLANHTVLIHRDGHQFAIEDSASPIRDRDNRTIGAILVFHDVSEKRSLLQQMMHQAYHDPLTGLPNRILFKDRLSLALAQAHRNKEMLAVLFLDLDRFKMVNDMMGHAVGDKVLKEVAMKIRGCLCESDTVARLGGDEFTILLPQISHEEEAAKAAQQIIQAFQQPWVIGGQEFHITTSVGITLFPNDGQDADTLLKHADTAMYRAKDQGKNNYQMYTPAMNARIVERMTMENSLRKALRLNEFEIFYQPQVNTKNGDIMGVEALIRWRHPEKGLVGPGEFIPLAEDSGLIVPVGEWVLRKACMQRKEWHVAGLKPVRVTVNLSAHQFQQLNLIEVIAQALEEAGLEPDMLELEITETALMRDLDFTIKMLNDLRKMGVRISIDDFGTGYSSLNYLKRFPIQTLKIDRSFIRDIVGSPEDAAIVSTVIALAQNFKLQVIAEGVETPGQQKFLQERNCYDMQGFLFARPLPAEEITVLLKEGRINLVYEEY